MRVFPVSFISCPKRDYKFYHHKTCKRIPEATPYQPYVSYVACFCSWSWYLLSPGTPVFNSPQKQKISKILIRSGARFSKFTVTIKYLNQIPGTEAPVRANKPLHFVQLTDSFIMLSAKLLRPLY